MTVVSFSMAYRSFRGGSGRLHTRLDTPPLINRRHPDSCLAPVTPSQFALRFRQLQCVLDTSEGGEDEIIVDAFGAGDGWIFKYRTPGNDDMIFSHFARGDVFAFPPDVITV